MKRGFNRTRLSSAVSRNGGSVWEFFQNVESMHEATRVEPPPIRPLRPVEYHFEPGVPAPEREPEHVVPADFHRRSWGPRQWCYPSMFVMKDRVLIAHTYSFYEEHATKAQLVLSRDKEGGDQGASRFGQSVGTAGDVNGDAHTEPEPVGPNSHGWGAGRAGPLAVPAQARYPTCSALGVY